EATYENITKPTPICAGIVVHESNPKGYVLNQKEGFITYAEALDHPDVMNGEHYIGIFMPQMKNEKLKIKNEVKFLPLKEKRAGGIGHAILQTTYTPGQPFVYYTGSAWSQYDVPTYAIWQETLRHEMRILTNGLQLVEH
ncbi:MAG: DUF4861 family protein, partial [Bacteroidaceae bacterium]|nr:DUF4861 family protein [Bacteroidaceae bacterium]